MKKELKIKIEDYTFGTALERGNKAFLYFDNNYKETESVKIPFINGFPETQFLFHQFGEITHWYKANDKWKGLQMKIVVVDERPMALIAPNGNEICLLKSPIFSQNLSFFVANGNLLYLKEKYGISEEEFINCIKQELEKNSEKGKVYQKRNINNRSNIHKK